MFSYLLLVSLAEARKSKGPPPPPPVGWAKEAGAKGDCYHPPDFAKLPEGDRKMARQAALEGMKSQWLGARQDGVTFNPDVVDGIETALLGRPEKIEAVAAENRDLCVAVMKGGAIGPWESWVGGLEGRLNAGECLRPFDYTLFDYLDIGVGWQRPIPVCKGEKVRITATVSDKYRIADGSEYITVAGTSEPATGPDYPCNIEGCMVGMLVGRFETDAGVIQVFPIGADKTFTAPENGTLTWAINDTTWYDNKWFKTSAIEDRAAVTAAPG